MFKRIIVSKHMRRRVSWFIAAILVFPFILFFHATGRTPIKGPGGIAGIIFGKHIPWEEFEQQQIWLKRQWQNRFDEIPDSLEAMSVQFAWDRLILLAEARRTKVRVDNAELASFIEKVPAFEENKRFSAERYNRYLKLTGQIPQVFEQLLRDDLAIEKLMNSIKSRVSVSSDELKHAYVKEHEQMRATVFAFNSNDFAEEVESSLTDSDIQSYYDKNPEIVRVPEQLVIEYVGTTRDDVTSDLPAISEEELKSFYEDNRANFTREDGTNKDFEEVKEEARKNLTDALVRKKLRNVALDLQDDLDNKLTFDEIVMIRSLTPHSVGPFPSGSAWVPNSPEPKLISSAVKLKGGTLSEVIETDAGSFIVRLTERMPSRIPTLDEVRDKIRSKIVQERTHAAAKKAADALRKHLDEKLTAGFRFEEAILVYNAISAHPAEFTREGPIEMPGWNPALNQSAFAMKLGQITDVLETAAGSLIIRPEELISADETKFSEEEDSLRKKLESQKQSEELERWLEALRSRSKLQSFVENPA